MDFLSGLRRLFADGRFGANLLTFYGVGVALVIASLVLRRLLARGCRWLTRWIGLRRVETLGEAALARARRWLAWGTAAGLVLTAAAGVVYHLAGRDVRLDVADRLEHLTAEDLVRGGVTLAALAVLGLAAWAGALALRRWRPKLEAHVVRSVGPSANEAALRLWFSHVERYAVAAVRLTALWAMSRVAGLGRGTEAAIGLLLRVITVLVVARLLTLAWRALFRTAAEFGQRRLGRGRVAPYWERVARLFPFGERCFTAAVYVWAGSVCLRELGVTSVLEGMLGLAKGQLRLGPRAVHCIGVLATTRVLIELVQVLLHDAFGRYGEDGTLDQKGRTLVPLLQSVCQYVLYFGSGVVMLGVLGFNILPILTGVGILGLAVGLGAQNLVTDLVSGFFILFENQYLVGDFVQIGDAAGTVESVGIRLTEVRDGQGKLHIIPNGQIKRVVSYSKGYVNAVVDMRVEAGSDLEAMFRAMAEAGRRLRQARSEALAETEVQGLIELGTSDMTVRAVTRVKPGTHLAMQNEYRRLLKQVLDQRGGAERAAA